MRLFYGNMFVPGFFALLLHACVMGLMLVNWASEPKHIKTPRQLDHIAAKLVVLPKDVVPPKAKPKAAPKIEKAKPKPAEFEAAKPEPIKQEVESKNTYNIEKEKEKEKPKKQPEKAEPEVKPDPVALARMRERANEIRRQQQARDAMIAAVESEQTFSDSAANAQVTQSYIALITRVIENNWNRPLSARNGMQAELLLQLIPSGEIVAVSVVQSSGDSAFDRSAENAVKKAGRFPELQSMPSDVFERDFRRLRFIFRPEDLRS